MKTSLNALLLSAALTGLVGGTTAAAQQSSNGQNTIKASTAFGLLAGADKTTDKHACKGKNDCKGKGGCKTGDNGCKAKNSCKGKGGCATDGSKPPKTV